MYDFVGVAVGNAIDEDIMALIDSDFISVNDFNGLADIVANVADRVGSCFYSLCIDSMKDLHGEAFLNSLKNIYFTKSAVFVRICFRH